MFQLLAYHVTAGVNDANVDMTAAADANFSQRNSHYIFTEPYQLLADIHLAASATRARYNVPTWNAIVRQQIYPPNRSATIPSNPQICDRRDYPPMIPQNEEVAVEESNNLGAATEEAYAFLWCAPPTWTRNIPRGVSRQILRATAAVTTVANAWSAPGNMTIVDPIKGGTYVVVGAECILATVLAFRIWFIRAPLYNGRKMTPGNLATQAIGNVPLKEGRNWLGEWGRFNTFELPQVDAYANAAAAVTLELRLDTIYLGEQMT